MLIHHKVREAWRPGYDEHEKSRVAARFVKVGPRVTSCGALNFRNQLLE